jgi:MFS family permease
MSKIINRIVRTLVISDFFLNLGWGLLSPIFAIYILQNITPENSASAVEVAGFAALFYWITKSLFEIPFGYYLDKHHGEKDDLWFMTIGTLIVAIVPIGFIFSTVPWHIYLLQMLHAIGMAMALPSWLAIFTRHIDKGKEAFEWSIETTSIGAGAGIAGGLGGVMAGSLGFNALFIFVSIFTFIAGSLFLFIRKDIFIRDKDKFVLSARSIVEP